MAPNIRFRNPKSLSKERGYTHVVEMTAPGRTAYIAGQLALDVDGKLVGAGDFRAQATQAFENLKAAVAEAGAEMASIVKINNYIVDIGTNIAAFGSFATAI